MTKLALVCVVLAAACSKKDDKATPRSQSSTERAKPTDPGAPTPTPAAAAAQKPARPKPPEDKNRTCHIVGSGAVTFEQTTHDGGPMAMAVMQWMDPEVRQRSSYANEGFIINCNGEKMSLSLLTANDKPFPMQPAKYQIGGGYSPVRVLGSINDGTEYKIAQGDGELEITAFDATHIAGKGSFTPKTFPERSGVTITFDFDMVREAAPAAGSGSGSGSAASAVRRK